MRDSLNYYFRGPIIYRAFLSPLKLIKNDFQNSIPYSLNTLYSLGTDNLYAFYIKDLGVFHTVLFFKENGKYYYSSIDSFFMNHIITSIMSEMSRMRLSVKKNCNMSKFLFDNVIDAMICSEKFGNILTEVVLDYSMNYVTVGHFNCCLSKSSEPIILYVIKRLDDQSIFYTRVNRFYDELQRPPSHATRIYHTPVKQNTQPSQSPPVLNAIDPNIIS